MVLVLVAAVPTPAHIRPRLWTDTFGGLTAFSFDGESSSERLLNA
jgi:hypothetical protein